MIISYFPTGGSSPSSTGGNLEKMSWSEISAISLAHSARDYFSIGDTKSFTLEGNTYHARIIGFEHDVKSIVDGSKVYAGITFETVEMYPTTTVYYDKSKDTKNIVYWGGDPDGLSSVTLYESTMRSVTMPKILSAMPSDLQSVIVPVQKSYHITRLDSGDTKYIAQVQDSVFLLAAIELGYATTTANSYEGETYEYYANCRQFDRIKGLVTSETDASLTARTRWTRTAYVASSTGNYAYVVTSVGGAGNGVVAGATRYFSFAFCV